MCQENGNALGTSAGVLSPGETMCQEAKVLTGMFFFLLFVFTISVFCRLYDYIRSVF